MSAGGLYGIGISGLQSYQTALNVTGHNLENMLTPGYSRQTLNFSENGTEGVLNGVKIDSINRVYSEFMNTEIRNNESNYNYIATYQSYASALDNYLGNDGSSVNNALQDFFEAFADASNHPTSITSRQVLLNNTESLISRFTSLQQQLDAQMSQINSNIGENVDKINALASQVANINMQITASSTDTGGLQDQRAQALQELSQYISINVVQGSKGTVDVYIGSSELLVLNGRVSTLATEANNADSRKLDVVLKSDFVTTNITHKINGGELGGLFSYRNEVLDNSARAVDLVSLVFADTINEQHRMGMDLNGNTKNDFFTDINTSTAMKTRVFTYNNNSNTADCEVRIDDVKQLQLSDYTLAFSNANDYILTRNLDGQTVATGSVAGFPETVSVDGFTLTLNSGTFGSGEKYNVAPTFRGASNLDLAITNSQDIALALPVRTTADINNEGTAVISMSDVTDINHASFSVPGQLNPPLRVEFLTGTSYQVVNANTSAVVEGPITYNPQIDNDIFPTAGLFDPGYRVSITGLAQQGDVYNIGYNTSGSGDNSNGLKLFDLKSQKLVGSVATYQDSYLQFTNGVASRTHYANTVTESAELLLQGAEEKRNSYSAVNMDEELANMMLFQQAYQASAQVIQVANNVFDTLLSVL